MSDFFQVGEAYRNRLGEYTVLEVSGEELAIRYQDGNEATVNLSLQRRIVQNIIFEKTIAAQAPYASSRRSGRRSLVPSSWGRDWHGLLEGDFKDGSAGTHWRNRGELGGAMSRELSDKTAKRYESYACYRRSEIHLYDPTRYNNDARVRQAKYVVDLCDACARVGFYIERDDSDLDETWDWSRFVAALGDDTELGSQVSEAMRRHGLAWFVYGPDRGEPLARAEAGPEPGQLLLDKDGESQQLSWPEWAAYLGSLDVACCDLYLGKDVARKDALAMGVDFSSHAAKVLADLLPLYQASTSA